MEKAERSRRRERIWAGLLILLIAVFICSLYFPIIPASWIRRFHSQARHLVEIEEHIKKIDPEWRQFRAANTNYSAVKLSAYTGGDGMFAAFGDLPSEASLLVLSNFLQSTKPPRPLYLGALTIRDDPAVAPFDNRIVNGRNGFLFKTCLIRSISMRRPSALRYVLFFRSSTRCGSLRRSMTPSTMISVSACE